MIKINSFKDRLFENLDVSRDVESKEYVIDVFKDMFQKYAEKFSGKSHLSLEELYGKFTNNILPGFADFMVNAEHSFGSLNFPSISNYLSVKHGCWLNSIDFMNKYSELYKEEELKLCYGFIVSNKSLEAVEKDLNDNIVPVGLELIPHGFMVVTADGETGVFDPTVGINKDYHYFYKEVPTEIWKSFKYFYNGPKDWEVKDFASWTGTMIRDDLKTKAFFDMVSGIEYSQADSENVTPDEDGAVGSNEDENIENLNSAENIPSEENIENSNTDENFNINQDEVNNAENIEITDFNDIENPENNFGESLQESSSDIKKPVSELTDDEVQNLIDEVCSRYESTGMETSDIYNFLASLDPEKEQDRIIYKGISNLLPTEYKIGSELDQRFFIDLQNKIDTFVNKVASVAEKVHEEEKLGEKTAYSMDKAVDRAVVASYFKPITSIRIKTKTGDEKLKGPNSLVESYQIHMKEGSAGQVLTIINGKKTVNKFRDRDSFPLYLILTNKPFIEEGVDKVKSFLTLTSTNPIYVHSKIWKNQEDIRNYIIKDFNKIFNDTNITTAITQDAKQSLLGLYFNSEDQRNQAQSILDTVSGIKQRLNTINNEKSALFVNSLTKAQVEQCVQMLLSSGITKFAVHFKYDNNKDDHHEYEEIVIDDKLNLKDLSFIKNEQNSENNSGEPITYTVSKDGKFKYTDVVEDIKKLLNTPESETIKFNTLRLVEQPVVQIQLSNESKSIKNNLLPDFESKLNSKVLSTDSDNHFVVDGSYFDTFDSKQDNVTHLKSISDKETQRNWRIETLSDFLTFTQSEQAIEFKQYSKSVEFEYKIGDSDTITKIKDGAVALFEEFIEQLNGKIKKEINPYTQNDNSPFKYSPFINYIKVVGKDETKNSQAVSIQSYPNNIINTIINVVKHDEEKAVSEIIEQIFEIKESNDEAKIQQSMSNIFSNRIYFDYNENGFDEDKNKKFRFFRSGVSEELTLDSVYRIAKYRNFVEKNSAGIDFFVKDVICNEGDKKYDSNTIYKLLINKNDNNEYEFEIQLSKGEQAEDAYDSIAVLSDNGDLILKQRNSQKEFVETIKDFNNTFFVITNKLDDGYREVLYQGKKYKYGDLVTVDPSEYPFILHRISNDFISQKTDAYKSLHEAFKKGFNASQSDIIDIMKYCRQIHLFNERTIEVDDGENRVVPNGYQITDATHKNDIGLQVIFGVKSLSNENDPNVISVLSTLNRDFNNVAAMYATRDDDSYRMHKSFLASFPRVFKQGVDQIETIYSEYDSKKKKEPGAQILSNSLLPIFSDDPKLFGLAQLYFDWFGVGRSGGFGNKRFAAKILGESEQSRAVSDMSSKLNKLQNLISETNVPLCAEALEEISKDEELAYRIEDYKLIKEILAQKEDETVSNYDFLHKLIDTDKMPQFMKDMRAEEPEKFRRYEAIIKTEGTSRQGIVDSYIFNQIENYGMNNNNLNLIDSFMSLFSKQIKNEQKKDKLKDPIDCVKELFKNTKKTKNTDVILLCLLDKMQLRDDVKASERKRKAHAKEVEAYQRQIAKEYLGVPAITLNTKYLSDEEKKKISKDVTASMSIQDSITERVGTWVEKDELYKEVNDELTIKFRNTLFDMLKNNTELRIYLENIQRLSAPSKEIIEKFDGSWIKKVVSVIYDCVSQESKSFRVVLYLLICAFNPELIQKYAESDKTTNIINSMKGVLDCSLEGDNSVLSAKYIRESLLKQLLYVRELLKALGRK